MMEILSIVFKNYVQNNKIKSLNKTIQNQLQNKR